jgi:hypothetical protein
MVLDKPSEPDLAQIGVEVAKRLREEIGVTILKSSESAKDEESVRTVWHLRSQRNVVSSSAELHEVLMDLERNRIGELGMCLEPPIVP